MSDKIKKRHLRFAAHWCSVQYLMMIFCVRIPDKYQLYKIKTCMPEKTGKPSQMSNRCRREVCVSVCVCVCGGGMGLGCVGVCK